LPAKNRASRGIGSTLSEASANTLARNFARAFTGRSTISPLSSRSNVTALPVFKMRNHFEVMVSLLNLRLVLSRKIVNRRELLAGREIRRDVLANSSAYSFID
jgi:hypothetical protein